MNLLSTLGLNEVSADPNEIPDGKYDGDIFKSEYVVNKDGSKVSHVITFRVTEGEHKGAQRQQWYTIGTDLKDANGNPATKVDEIAAYVPAMSEQSKSYYKKLWLDLGTPEHLVNSNQIQPADLIGKQVTFGVKKNGQFVNVNFVELREPATTVAIDSSAPSALPF